jgi:hypothetical protein
MACLSSPISQPLSYISRSEITNSKRLLSYDRFFIGFYTFKFLVLSFHFTDGASGGHEIGFTVSLSSPEGGNGSSF